MRRRLPDYAADYAIQFAASLISRYATMFYRAMMPMFIADTPRCLAFTL